MKKLGPKLNVAALARMSAGDALEVLKEALKATFTDSRGKKVPDHHTRITAADKLLDRAIGRPVAMTADVTDRLDEFTDAQIDSAIDELEARLGNVAKTIEKEESSTITH